MEYKKDATKSRKTKYTKQELTMLLAKREKDETEVFNQIKTCSFIQQKIIFKSIFYQRTNFVEKY